MSIPLCKSHSFSMNGRFFRQKRVRRKPGHQVDHKIAVAPVPGMLDLADVFQKIVYRLDHGAPPQQKSVCKAQHPWFFGVLFLLSDQLHAFIQEGLKQFLGRVPFVSEKLSKQFFCQAFHNFLSIDTFFLIY